MSLNENSRNFTIVEVKKQYNRQNFAYFNLRDASIVLNKNTGGGKLRKHFDCNSFQMIEKCGAMREERSNVLQLLGSVNSPLGAMQSSNEPANITREDLRLRVTIQPYKQQLQRRLWEFETIQSRDLFVDLLSSLVLSNGKAFNVFQSLSTGGKMNVAQVSGGLEVLGIDSSLIFGGKRPLKHLVEPAPLSPASPQSKSTETSKAIANPEVPLLPRKSSTAHPQQQQQQHTGNSRKYMSDAACTCTPPQGLSKTQMLAFRLTHPHQSGPVRQAPSPHNDDSSIVRVSSTSNIQNNKPSHGTSVSETGSFESLKTAYDTLSHRFPQLQDQPPSLKHLLSLSTLSDDRRSEDSVAPTPLYVAPKAPSAPQIPSPPTSPVSADTMSTHRGTNTGNHIATRRGLLQQFQRYTSSRMKGESEADAEFPMMYSFESFLLVFLDLCSIVAELLAVPLGGPLVCKYAAQRNVTDVLRVTMVNGVLNSAVNDVEKPHVGGVNRSQRLLHGEAQLLTTEQCWQERALPTFASAQGLCPRLSLVNGSLQLTTYRLLFQSSDAVVSVPMGTICSVEEKEWTDGGNTGCLSRVLLILTKDDQKHRFITDGVSLSTSLVDMINTLAFTEDQEQSFAYAHTFPTMLYDDMEIINESMDGWKFFNHEAEYKRMGVPHDHPRFRWMSNDDYKLSPTYPRVLIIPRSFSDEEIHKVCKFRSRARLPVITYRYAGTGATISRCAQPLVGLIGKSSTSDETLIACIREANTGNNKILYIMDARPHVAALGNKLQGKGSENMSRYTQCNQVYQGIDNIHAIREALNSMTSGLQYNDKNEKVDETANDVQIQNMAASKWLYYVSLLLSSATRIAQVIVEESASILIHCSDGWDRSAQLPSLAELILDPYYRTCKGFAVLIEKDWLSFGHQFALRHGHCTSNVSSQRAPIFIQFLDCVYQMIRQMPNAFEFNENFLLALGHHVTSCRFGTFLFNSERERELHSVKTKTTSIWTYLCHPSNAVMFSNTSYKEVNKPLFFDCSARRIVVWERMFMKYLVHGPQSTDSWILEAGTKYRTQGGANLSESQDERLYICPEAQINALDLTQDYMEQTAIWELLRRCKTHGIDVSDVEGHIADLPSRVQKPFINDAAQRHTQQSLAHGNMTKGGNTETAFADDDNTDEEVE